MFAMAGLSYPDHLTRMSSPGVLTILLALLPGSQAAQYMINANPDHLTRMSSPGVLTILLLALLPGSQAAQYMINASVMGYPQSQDTDLYRKLSDILLKEDGSKSDKVNYCSIHFNKVSFDKTNGSTILESLEAASKNFDKMSIAVAIGPYIDVFTSTDYVISNQLHMLTSSAGQKSEMMDPDMVVSILPDQKSLSKAVSQIILKLGWNNVAYLSKEDFSTVLELDSNNIQVWPIRLPNRIESDQDPELVRNLIELRASQKIRFILHSNERDTILHVMKAAKRLHLLHPTIKWFVDYPDIEDILKDDEDWSGTIYGLQLLREDKIPTNISHIADQRNLSRLEIGLAVDVVGLLRHVIYKRAKNCSQSPAKDYVIRSDEFTDSLKDKGSAYQGALGQYMWSNQGRSNYTIDIMKYNRKLQLQKIGQCEFVNGTPSVDITITDKDSGKHGAADSSMEMLRVVARLNEPFVMKDSEGEYVGFNVDLLTMIAEKLNFKFEIFDISDREYGVMDGKPVNGMIEEILTGNASMAVGKLEVTAEREEVISFSYTILSTRASILIKKGKSTRNFFQFLGPFSTELWIMILLFIMVAGLSLYAMSRFDHTQENSEQRFDLKESVWYSINVVLQGTTEYSPQTTSMRTIIAFFWFCVLIIDAAYTANLAAFLTLQQIDDRIRTVYDLAGQSEIMYGVEKNSNLMTFFKDAKMDPYERMWAFMKLEEDNTLLSNTSEIIEKVQSGNYAFIADMVVNDYYALKHCGLESIEQNFAQKEFSLGFPRGAPYRDDVNRALLQLKENGRLDELTKKWWSSGTNCTGDSETRSVTEQTTAELELTNMFGVFIVLGSFVLLAVIVEIGERIQMCVEAHKKKQAEKEEKIEEDTKPRLLSEGFQPPPVPTNPEKFEKPLIEQ